MTITITGKFKLSPGTRQEKCYPCVFTANFNPPNKKITSFQHTQGILPIPSYPSLFSKYWQALRNRYIIERPFLYLHLLLCLLFTRNVRNHILRGNRYTQYTDNEINQDPQLQELATWTARLKLQSGINDPIYLGFRNRAEGEECNEEQLSIDDNTIYIEKRYSSDKTMMRYIKTSIAHELAHYKFKHGLRRFLRAWVVVIIDTLVFAMACHKRSLLHLGILIVLDVAAMHFELFLSRRDEKEADREANKQLKQIAIEGLMGPGRMINWVNLPNKIYQRKIQLEEIACNIPLESFSPQDQPSLKTTLISFIFIYWGAEIEKRLHYPPWLSTHPPHAERIVLDNEN